MLQACRILRHLRQTAPQARDEPRIVRVIAVERAVLANYHAVDRTQGAGGIRKLVQVLHDGLLTRVRDVESVKTQQRRRIQKRRCGGAIQVQSVQVDGAVQVTHPVCVRLSLMHGRGQGGGDAVTNEAHQEGFSTQTHSFTVRVGTGRGNRVPNNFTEQLRRETFIEQLHWATPPGSISGG